MARKVFISFLGTGFYGKCQYAYGNFTSTSTRFIQKATLEMLDVKNNWTSDDEVCILLTEKARKDNWTPVGNMRSSHKGAEEEPYTGLSDIIKNMSLPMAPTEVDIPDGKDANEMWEIFSQLYGHVHKDDEVYLDITHSFRFMPMLMLVWSNYAKFLKHVKVVSITYGNFEGRNGDIAPIIDLLPLTQLQDWTFAAANYLKNGDMSQLSVLSGEQLKPILREAKGNNPKATSLRTYMRDLLILTDDIRFARGKALSQAEDVKNVRKAGSMLNESVGMLNIPPLAPILEKVEQSLTDFDATPDNRTNGLVAARWCLDKELYQAAVTHLQEAIVTFFCVHHDIEVTDQKMREAVNRAFKKLYYKYNPDKGKYEACKTPEVEKKVDELTGDAQLKNATLVNDFNELEDLRNDFNHAGMRENARSVNKLRDKVKNAVDDLTALLLEEK